ncbi:MAG: type II toxin-antitoxin system RelE/ParE family toxin [Verrucomicrobiaceae bacterium]|nr:MAG: type II toxin-antitoxin system RelE/ParE family toxin [Verrucomicrobiaceae bacterium]
MWNPFWRKPGRSGRMMKIRILPAARARLLEIWSYTAAQWGEVQADKYLRDLVSTMERLDRRHMTWKPVRDAELDGVFFLRHAHHFIFFRAFPGGGIGVISILHETMDIPARLREDTGD